MPYTEIARETVLGALFTYDNVKLYPFEVGVFFDPSLLDKRFKIDGLANTILQTHHLAKWVVSTNMENGRVDLNRNRIGDLRLDLSIGEEGNDFTLTYYPEMPQRNDFHFNKCLEHLFLYYGNNPESVIDTMESIRSCKFKDGLIVFEFEKPYHPDEAAITKLSISPGKQEYQITYNTDPPAPISRVQQIDLM